MNNSAPLPETPTAITVAVVRQADTVLIGPRPQGKPLSGYWEFPGGKIKPGESPEDAAIRECLEETALRIRVTRLLTTIDHRYQHDTLHLHFFEAAPINHETQPRPPFRWIPITELHNYQFPPANDTVLKLLKTDA